jgi:deferrochelatase/peroxidase EfeB
MDERFQEGLFHGPGQHPGPFFTLLSLRAAPGASARQVGAGLAELWGRYQLLKQGLVQDLAPEKVPGGNLSVLVGYGPKSFELPEAARPLPEALGARYRFRKPEPTGGGMLLRGSGLAFDADVVMNHAAEEIVVQFIADTQLAVHRAVVETWKFLFDLGESAPLSLAGFFQGFGRDDGRSWIDFHDGVSNMRSNQRASVMAIKPGGLAEDAWTVGGTYLAFIRVGVDLAAWRRIPKEKQELLVGRAKLSGCPFASRDAYGHGVPIAGCGHVSEDPAFFEPPTVDDPVLLQSHVQRANHHVGALEDNNSLRVYRQGYEFFEPLERAPGFRAGLNFVSFQDTPARLFRMLTTDTWLGRTNFGGEPGSGPGAIATLLRVRAGGVFLVPPVEPAEKFPGASIFGV